MSNCVTIESRHSVEFRPGQIDSERFRDFLARCEQEVNYNNRSKDGVDRRLQMGWWFLSSNTTFKIRGGCTIYFGQGRSSHTWRDFQGTIQLISEFVTADKGWYFIMSNEFDGFASKFKVRVDFRKGVIVDG